MRPARRGLRCRYVYPFPRPQNEREVSRLLPNGGTKSFRYELSGRRVFPCFSVAAGEGVVLDGIPKRSVLRWFGTVPSLPWWMEYGAPFVVIVVLGRARPPLATLIIVGISYVVAMQMLRVLVNDARQGGHSALH